MLQTDTIPTPGWWLRKESVIYHGGEPGDRRVATPFTSLHLSRDVALEIRGYTHDPEAALAWVRDGVLP